MDVVQQFQFLAHTLPHRLEHNGYRFQVRLLVHEVVGRAAEARRLVVGCLGGGAHGAVTALLNANVLETLGLQLLNVVGHRLGRVAVGVAVTGNCEAYFSTQQLIDGHPGAFAFDVPKRLVQPAEGVVQYGAIAPV